MFKYETHMHTGDVSKCAQGSPAEMVKTYKNAGYAGIIVTNHFSLYDWNCPDGLSWAETVAFYMSGYEAAKRVGDLYGLDVFLGFEYNDELNRDFLTYGLGADFLMELGSTKHKSIEEYSAMVRRGGGYLAQAHPFRDDKWSVYPYPAVPKMLDGVEVYNPGESSKNNGKALAYAKRHNLPMQSGSDAHSTKESYVSGILLRRRAKSIHDIIRAIKTGEACCIIPG